MGSSGNALCGSLAGDAVSADGEESPTITSAPRAAAAVPACIPRFIANLMQKRRRPDCPWRL